MLAGVVNAGTTTVCPVAQFVPVPCTSENVGVVPLCPITVREQIKIFVVPLNATICTAVVPDVVTPVLTRMADGFSHGFPFIDQLDWANAGVDNARTIVSVRNSLLIPKYGSCNTSS